jgi:hypothetical protein
MVFVWLLRNFQIVDPATMHDIFDGSPPRYQFQIQALVLDKEIYF